jgi:chaperonin GroES
LRYNKRGIGNWFAEKKLKMNKNKKPVETGSMETVEPIGRRVLIRKDEDKKQTKGGIQLPDNIEIPTITGRIVAVSAEVENEPDLPLRQYDKILFNPKGAIPVDFEGDNRLFVVEVENVVAVFRKD